MSANADLEFLLVTLASGCCAALPPNSVTVAATPLPHPSCPPQGTPCGTSTSRNGCRTTVFWSLDVDWQMSGHPEPGFGLEKEAPPRINPAVA